MRTLLLSFVLVAGCPHAEVPECEELGMLCHSSSTTLGQECHELGHHGEKAQCVARRAECLAECVRDMSAATQDLTTTHD